MLGGYLEGAVGNCGEAGVVTAFPQFGQDAPTTPEPSVEGRHRYRTIWISDVHLGTRGCNARRLIDFLDATDSETMYLVGDIIDGWRLKKKFYWPPAHNDVVWRILKRARRGTRIVYIPGNHDEMSASSPVSASAGSRYAVRRFTIPPMAADLWFFTATSSTA